MSFALILVIAAVGLVLLNVGYLKRANAVGLTLMTLGVICMVVVISGGIYAALHG